MSNDPNSSTHERGPLGTFSDNATGGMWSGGKIHTPAEQIAAGVNASTDRTTAEIIMATTPVSADQIGGPDGLKAVTIFFATYSIAFLIPYFLYVIGIPNTSSILIQYLVFVTVAAVLFIMIREASISLQTKLTLVGCLVIAQSAFAIYKLASTAFIGLALVWLVLYVVRIAIGVGIIRGRAVARIAFVAIAVISALMLVLAAKFSVARSFVFLFGSPLGFPSSVICAFLLFSGELRSGFKVRGS